MRQKLPLVSVEAEGTTVISPISQSLHQNSILYYSFFQTHPHIGKNPETRKHFGNSQGQQWTTHTAGESETWDTVRRLESRERERTSKVKVPAVRKIKDYILTLISTCISQPSTLKLQNKMDTSALCKFKLDTYEKTHARRHIYTKENAWATKIKDMQIQKSNTHMQKCKCAATFFSQRCNHKILPTNNSTS